MISSPSITIGTPPIGGKEAGTGTSTSKFEGSPGVGAVETTTRSATAERAANNFIMIKDLELRTTW
jgi:hypothetical protein